MTSILKNIEDDSVPISPNENDSMAFAFSDKVIRRGFIRKVYSILMAQLLVTTSVIAFFLYYEPANKFLQDNSELMLASWIASLILVVVIACVEDARRKAPANMIILCLFTLAMSMTLAFTATIYGAKEILIAASITLIICFSLTVFAFQTKWDFTVFGGILYVSLIIFLIFGIFSLIFQSYWLLMLKSSLGALLFSAYLIYDTQLIIGGNHKYSISPEEYIYGALSLYLDIINIFLTILRLTRQ